MNIYPVTHKRFRTYGRILEDLDLTDLSERLLRTPVPEDVLYVPSEPSFQETEAFSLLRERRFGGMPIQAGYCNGQNRLLNALEFHKSSEINLAGTDLILLLGRLQDLKEDLTYDTGQAEAFFVPARTAVELYGTTLHYAPCQAKEGGFRCAVILPEGTNLPLPALPSAASSPSCQDRLLTARNKWLIAHREADISGAFPGLKGENLSVTSCELTQPEQGCAHTNHE